MGFVEGFVDEIISPLETAAGQIRQLSKAHVEADNHFQTRVQGLKASFQGEGAQTLFTMAQRQKSFVTGITNELNDFAGAFEETVHIVREAAQVADWALGGPLLDIAQHILGKLSPDIVVRQGQSAVSAVADDMRKTFHDMLDKSGSFFGDVFHGHFGAALHDAGSAFGDLIHLGGDLFALLDQVETILGHWAAKVMEKANWLLNSIQSFLFKIEDFIFGFSQISDNAAILADPNSTPEEKGIAIAGLGLTALSDILMFIPGAEEGGVALDATEKTLVDEAESEVEQQVEKEVEQEVEQEVEKEVEQEVEQGGTGGEPPINDGNGSGISGFDDNNPPGTRESVVKKLNDYLLNPDHPAGGPKAKWFQSALGFTRENMSDLAKQIIFDPSTAVETGVTQYGTKYNQIISIVGANGKTIDVTFAWIKNNDGIVRLVTAIPTKLK